MTSTITYHPVCQRCPGDMIQTEPADVGWVWTCAVCGWQAVRTHAGRIVPSGGWDVGVPGGHTETGTGPAGQSSPKDS